MKSGKILQIASIIFLVMIIGLITISIAPSLSVGGTSYSSDSETCATCHIEVPYVEGYRNSSHSNGDVSCIGCHQYSSPIKDANCLTCHQDDYITNSTLYYWDWSGYLTPIDPHVVSHIPFSCTQCHIEHKFLLGVPREVTESQCRECHTPIPEGANLDDYEDLKDIYVNPGIG